MTRNWLWSTACRGNPSVLNIDSNFSICSKPISMNLLENVIGFSVETRAAK